MDQGLQQTLRCSPVWREQDDLLRSVSGVGEQLSLTLLAGLPELGTLDRSPGGSGPHEPRQRDHAGLLVAGSVGRARVRAVLYMARW